MIFKVKRSDKMNFKKHLKNQEELLKSNNINKDVSLSNVIRKRYKNRQALDAEFYTIKLLQSNGVDVARVLFVQGDTAVFENVDGITYDKILDRIEQGLLNESSIKRVAKELCDWMKKYYNATATASREDINFKNFIFTPLGKCSSINFEHELQFCRYEYDMGRILIYVATYDPMFTIGKLNMCRALLECFLEMGADIDLIEKEYKAEFEALKMCRAGFAKLEPQIKGFWNLIVK